MRITLLAAVVLLVAVPFLVSRQANSAYARPAASVQDEEDCVQYIATLPCCQSNLSPCICQSAYQIWCSRTQQNEDTRDCTGGVQQACYPVDNFIPADTGVYYSIAPTLCVIPFTCTNQAGGSLCYDVCVFQPLISCSLTAGQPVYILEVQSEAGWCGEGAPQ